MSYGKDPSPPHGLPSHPTTDTDFGVEPQGKRRDEASIHRLSVIRASPGSSTQSEQDLICEVPMTLYVNEQEIVTLLTIPHERAILAVGFLFSEGWITDKKEIEWVQADDSAGVVRVQLRHLPAMADRFWERRTIGSGCGKATSFVRVMDAMQCRPVSSAFRTSISNVIDWTRQTLEDAPLYKRTRGTHSVSLYGEKGRILFEQDIGRHNALDRILGKCFLQNIPSEDAALITTGRLSSEMIVKAARLGVPILVSRSSTTTLAISLAEKLQLTILGCLRAGGMIVYTHPHRLRDRG